MKKYIICISAVLLLAIQLSAQNALYNRIIAKQYQGFSEMNDLFKIAQVSEGEKQELEQEFKTFSVAAFSKDVVKKIIEEQPAALRLTIPVDGNLTKISLVKNPGIPAELKIKTGNDKRVQSYKTGMHYLGVIDNDPNSIVAFSFFENDLTGMMSTKKGNYFIAQPASVKSRDIVMVYNDKDRQNRQGIQCGMAMQEAAINNIKSNVNRLEPLTATPEKCIKIYFETDYAFYQKFASTIDPIASVTNYVTTLFNNIYVIYANESISLKLSETLTIWTTTDPWAEYNSTSNVGLKFAIDKGTSFDGDLAHLISARGFDDATGIAYGTICNGSIRSALSTRMGLKAPSYLLPYFENIQNAAHEIGHNLGCFYHTQQNEWNGNNTPIDYCSPSGGIPTAPFPLPVNGGTIMSYCGQVRGLNVNFAEGLGIQPGNLIRAFIAAAECLDVCETECKEYILISGNYFTKPLTESSTWIASANTTRIFGGFITLDVDTNQYVQLNPGFEAIADNFGNDSYFIAEPNNGCTPQDGFYKYSGEKIQVAKDGVINNIIIYPNPATEFLLITGKEISPATRIQLFDNNGKMIAIQTGSSSQNLRKIIVRGLPNGLYILRISTNNTHYWKKIIIQ